MHKLLKSTMIETAPGLTLEEQEDYNNLAIFGDQNVSKENVESSMMHGPLKQGFQNQKKYLQLQNRFGLSTSEILVDEISSVCTIMISGAQTNFHGKLYISSRLILNNYF